MQHDYQRIEKLFSQLLTLLAATFSDAEVSEVREFIDAGEYGLALETLVDIVLEEGKRISTEEAKLVYELVDAMNLDRKQYEERLSGRLVDF